MSALGAERQAVQEAIVRYACEVGWRYLPPEEALRLRHGETGIILREEFVARAINLNPDFMDRTRAEELLRQIERVPPTINGNLQVWQYLKGLRTLYVQEERRERPVRLLDPDHPEANACHVTDELVFTNGTHTIRADVVFFINGVPLLIFETKAAQRQEAIAEALDQLARYHREAPEMMAVLQLYGLTNLLRFYYGATWNVSRGGLFNWKEEQAGDFETLVKHFVQPGRVLRIIADFILFSHRDGELQKTVLRPHQMRAAERVVRRAKDPQKRRGLVWHTQGSGKTYTMLTVARKLLEDPDLKNPTVLMLVDRNELEQQLSANIEAVGSAGSALAGAVVADSKRELRELLERDHRGLIVSTIHKFDDMPPNVNPSRHIYVLIDEAHRSTSGDLGNHLMGALPNATYIGFTGTPIDRSAHGQGTFKVFGIDDPPKGYLDKYSIRESIEDGTTVPLRYTLAPNDLLLDRDVLDREFLEVLRDSGVSDLEEIDRTIGRSVVLQNLLKSRDRVEKVAAYVARHFRENVEPMGYKAFLVAADREACALYKAALDRHLPPEHSRVVISAAHNDPPELARHHMSEEEEQRVRRAFRHPDELPKILIVTEKLLTGYDAPILYCMYLDKPMRDHVLLQAIARVNRPYEDSAGRRKTSGLIVDFVGVFDRLEKALAFDSEDVSGLVEHLDVLREHFRQLIEERDYLGVWRGRSGDKAVEAVLSYFLDPEVREEFYRWFRDLQEVYEILSPDPCLSPYQQRYEELARMYELVRSSFDSRPLGTDRSLLRKTIELLREQVRSTGVAAGEEHVLDADALARLAREDRPDIVKVFNLVKAIKQIAGQEGAQRPYLLTFGQRAEEVARQLEERQLSTAEALRELLESERQMEVARHRQEELGLSDSAFTVFWVLTSEGGFPEAPAREAAERIHAALQEHPYWRQNRDSDREVRISAYREVLRLLAAARGGMSREQRSQLASKMVDRILDLLRRGEA